MVDAHEDRRPREGAARRPHPSLRSTLSRFAEGEIGVFGIIPEFIGRLPVLACLEDLDEKALVNILTQPKNALTKQYKRMLELDGVQLRFTDDALKMVAIEAIKRNTGARGLRSILESAMLEVMFDIPSQQGVREIVINEAAILHKEAPLIVMGKPDDPPPSTQPATLTRA